MFFKFFTRLFLLIGMMAFLSAPMRAEEVVIGSGTTTDAWLPSHSYYKYSLTQQLYKADEIGNAGEISSIAFFNGGSEKERTYDIYLVNTSKNNFSGGADWITVSADDLVFSGSVKMLAGDWTTITFDTPFQYEGENLAVVVNDKTGSYSSGMACRVFTPSGGDQGVLSLYASRDSGNYDLSNPGNATGIVTYKNQIKLTIESIAVSCAKPKSLAVTNITAHSATLTWQAGAEGQSNWDVYLAQTATDVPDETTTPTFQFTTCSMELSGLATQTTYYAYVRAVCDADDKSNWASKTFTTIREALTVNAETSYDQDFETSNDWGFSNGTLTNQWCWGNATNHGGEKAMYVSNDSGTTHAYSHGNTVIYASKLFDFAQGTYTFFFDWLANGESTYDFLRVALVPGDQEFNAGTDLPLGVSATALPNTWISLDGEKLNLKDSWQTRIAEATVSGVYTMVFLWRNDYSGGSQPPAAIDNISISYMTCPRPTNLAVSNIGGRTATLSWTENGTASNWVLNYATNSSFTENFTEVEVSGEALKELTGLMAETQYYARVKSVLGTEESSWSDPVNFTTTATCEKPTLSFVTYSNTAHTGTVSWTGTADHYELIYSTNTNFNPGDEGVVQASLENVNTYTLQDLAPETTYRIKVRANCGEEDGYSQWSDQVSFTTTATCVAPSGLSASATASTITLTWTAGAEDQDAWDIRYKTGSDEYTYIHLEDQTITSYTLTDLSPVTTYSVNVRAYCSEEDQSKWGYSSYNQNYDLSVTTDCAALTLPYTCDFEGALETSQSSSYPMPKCWTRKEYRGGYTGSYTYYPSVRSASYSQPYAHGGSGESATSGKSLHFYKPYASSDEAAILPEVDEQYGMRDLQISFWARLESYQTNKDLTIGVMSNPDDLNSFVEIATVTVKDENFQEYTVFFDYYLGEGRNIAIRYNSNSTGYIFVDDVTVDVAAGCRAPQNLEATVESDDQATLTWAVATERVTWNVQYKKASESEWSELIPVNVSACTLTGLKHATVYEARVQTQCGPDEQSDWVEVSFTTDCGIWPIDTENFILENFDDDTYSFPPACWNIQPSYNGWGVNFNNAMVNDQPEPHGAAYSGTISNGWVFLILPPMHIEGNAILSFDQLFGATGTATESSIAVTSLDGTFDEFTPTIWTADANNLPTTRTNVTVSLADYDGQDILLAFKYDGNGTSSRTWYIDNVEVYVEATQNIELSQGMNWCSFNVDVTLSDVQTALANALPNTNISIRSQLNGVSLYNGLDWRGTLSTLDVAQMYLIYVNSTCEISLEGKPVLPSKHPVSIRPGANWLAFPLSETLSISDAFAGFAVSGDLIKSNSSSSAFNGIQWRGALKSFEPGEGYIYQSNATETRTFVYPSSSK